MSSRSVLIRLSKFPQRNCALNGKNFLRNYSKRVASAIGDGDFGNRRRARTGSKLVWRDPSFELLTSHRFPLFLRGDIGLAWFDVQSTLKTHHEIVMEQIDDNGQNSDADMVLRVQTCPKVLRDTVRELFSYTELEKAELSVVSIHLKPDPQQIRSNKESETEKMAQMFLITAKNVCKKLRDNGYWADFINPFSGKPYLVPTSSTDLYKSDEKFRCLDFQIFEIEECKIVSNEGGAPKRFVGNLFTNAPCDKKRLNDMFTSSNSDTV